MGFGDSLRFRLKGKVAFSGEIKKAEADIGVILHNAGDILLKGAPKGKEGEAAKIISWRPNVNGLDLDLESGRYVRAHDALLRLIKVLASELGKKYKLGIREVKAIEYKIVLPSTEISDQALDELRQLPYEVKVYDTAVEVHMKDLTEAELRGRIVDRLVSMIEEIITRAPTKVAEPQVVKHSPKRPHQFCENPFDVAKRLGWIVEFPARGQWIYKEPYARLLRALEDIFIKEVARPLKFEEVMLPKLIPLEVMQRMPGYLDGVPEGMYYVSPPPREPAAFSKFKQKLKLTKRIPSQELSEVIKEPAYVLSPAQCEPFYESFALKRLRTEDLPVKQFDCSGWTYRWEGGGVEGLVRTQEFRRMEFVFVGSPDDAVSIREAILDISTKILDRLDLEWRILVATPFYMREEGVETDLTDSSKIATYDIEVPLPYDDGWLEIGSYNLHRSKFVETFKIKEVKGREVWTGCCGFGTSRWMVGFLAQHGFDVKKWPELVRKRVGSMPSVPKVID